MRSHNSVLATFLRTPSRRRTAGPVNLEVPGDGRIFLFQIGPVEIAPIQQSGALPAPGADLASYPGAPDRGACASSIFVRVDIAQLFRLPLQLVPWMIHPTDSQIQTRSAPRDHAPSGSHAVPGHLRDFDPSQRPRTIPESRGTGDRRACPPPAACGLRPRSAATATEPTGPNLLGRPFAALAAMEKPPRRRSSGDRGSLASPGLPTLLAFDLYARPWPSPYL